MVVTVYFALNCLNIMLMRTFFPIICDLYLSINLTCFIWNTKSFCFQGVVLTNWPVVLVFPFFLSGQAHPPSH